MTDSTWEEKCIAAPLGTKAPARDGGFWTKTRLGWKWTNGATFPCPGGDWTGELIPPKSDKPEEDEQS